MHVQFNKPGLITWSRHFLANNLHTDWLRLHRSSVPTTLRICNERHVGNRHRFYELDEWHELCADDVGSVILYQLFDGILWVLPTETQSQHALPEPQGEWLQRSSTFVSRTTSKLWVQGSSWNCGQVYSTPCQKQQPIRFLLDLETDKIFLSSPVGVIGICQEAPSSFLVVLIIASCFIARFSFYYRIDADSLMNTYIFIRLKAHIGNTLPGKRTVLTRSALTPPKVNRFGWNLELCKPNVGGWPWHILGAICAVATVSGRAAI